MPKVSERQLVIDEIEQFIEASLLLDALDVEDSSSDESSESSSDSDMDPIDIAFELLTDALGKRYHAPRLRVPKSNHFRMEILFNLPCNRFAQQMRMSPTAFRHILNLIEINPIFMNNGHCPQRDVRFQLAVTLYRFGRHGNGVSLADITHMGISEGSVELYTNRVIVALLSLEREWVRWPNEEEKKSIKRSIEEISGFPSCIGFVDGTHVGLFAEPVKHGEDYFNRKNGYSINTLIVCDLNGKITYVLAGFPGSCHDMRVFTNSRLATHSNDFFTGELLFFKVL